MRPYLRWIILGIMVFPIFLQAKDLNAAHPDPIAPILFWVTLILFFALVGRYLAKRCRQPGVLGELLMGVLLGNLAYYMDIQLAVILREGPDIFDIIQSMLSGLPLREAVYSRIHDPKYAEPLILTLSGPHALDWVKIGNILEVFSRYGIIFLLFMVGLESSVGELKKTGRESLQVAILGVIAPIILGFLVAHFFLPTASYKVDLFVGATLAATSIGITARVLSEMKTLRTREARTILGAAMIDDILGLIILAVVSTLVTTDTVNAWLILRITMAALLFFVGALVIGPVLLQAVVRFFNFFLESWEVKLFASFIFLMLFAWVATLLGLAAIIGAFCAGLVLHDGLFTKKGREERSINHLMAPLESILAPLFFILIGMQVKLESFANWQVLFAALALIAAAILGKLISGLGGNPKDDRLLIGIGMLPRGEVGLVFASIGSNLGVISADLFSAIILMVIVTTFLAPLLLKLRYKKQGRITDET